MDKKLVLDIQLIIKDLIQNGEVSQEELMNEDYRNIIFNSIYDIFLGILEKKSDIEILAIGIGHDVSRYYDRAIKITDVNELGDVMISQLSSLFETKKKLH